MIGGSLGAISAVAVPLVLMTIAAFDGMPLDAALRASTIVLIVTLGAVAYLDVRRERKRCWQRLLVLLIGVAVGALVVLSEVSTHS
jgi:uncharacterized membrane protein YfcA